MLSSLLLLVPEFYSILFPKDLKKQFYARNPWGSFMRSVSQSFQFTAYSSRQHHLWTKQQWASILFLDELHFSLSDDS
ncbi:hypothetical protein TNCT_556711 [Trichonephila clavata]|uniref:Uncharacterized protein n=1 Tax=Trichonephila clavata TaxID=2740835 RepID=A0A8X6IXJ5_TRICU|nr:hypothetical protein TNCT_556711 [Trichonephila clavata]